MRVDDVVDTLFWIVRKNEIRSNPLILMVSKQYPFWMEKIIPFNNIFQWELWYNIHYKLKLNFNNIILTSSMLQFHIPEKLSLKTGKGEKKGWGWGQLFINQSFSNIVKTYPIPLCSFHIIIYIQAQSNPTADKKSGI